MANKTVDEIKKEMEANSKAWHTADAETRKKLEAENQRLGAQIGGSYDSASGAWSDKSGNSLYSPTSSTPKATAGNTYKSPDGTVWVRGTDGTVSVNRGEPQNTYSPTSAGPVKTEVESTAAATPASNGGSSPYTAVGTHNDAGLDSEALAKIEIYKNIYNSAVASGDMDTAQAAHDAAQAVRAEYGYSGGIDGSDYIELEKPTQPVVNPSFDANGITSWNDTYDQSNAQPSYTSKYDPQIDAMLNEILSREDFSYDVASDPLYRQYANMYNREGDRAMRETLAEAAAGAGGMNTYAITAAQQAANYYNSQLNDRIPELYQLAYEMYLADKDSKVQDLGLLQGMDATQYNRYRDTMSDWRNDKSFAYGVFQDAVAQNNWEKNFENNNYWNGIEYGEGTTPLGWNGSDGGNGDTPLPTSDPSDTDWENIQKGFTDLGLPYGVMNPNVLADLDDKGGIYEKNGKLYWADGWNAQNFQTKLRATSDIDLPGRYLN